MPKKFKGENSKAAEAKAKKEAIRQEEKAKKEKAIEDEYWRDDDKHVQRKQQRKDDKDRKRQEQQDRKQELRQLEEEEMASLKSAKPSGPTKVTRAQVELNREKIATAADKKERKELEDDEPPIEENLNRLMPDGEEARTVEDAISVLSVKEAGLDHHPEKRVKAAYAAYEEVNLPRLKQENPNFRLSQLKQMLKKDWMKSPENPLNQRTAAYNSSRR